MRRLQQILFAVALLLAAATTVHDSLSVYSHQNALQPSLPAKLMARSNAPSPSDNVSIRPVLSDTSIICRLSLKVQRYSFLTDYAKKRPKSCRFEKNTLSLCSISNLVNLLSRLYNIIK